MSHRIRLFVFIAMAISLLTGGTSASFGVDSAAALPAQDYARFTAAVAEGAALQVGAPAAARVGDVVSFTVSSDGLQGVAGFQFALRYDEAALDFYQVELSDEVKALGYDVLKMGPVRQDGMVLFGAALCTVAECDSTDYTQARRSAGIDLSQMPLVKLNFYVRQPGAHLMQLDKANMVSAAGLPVVTGEAAADAGPMVALQALDLTQNGMVNDSDAYAVISEWMRLAETGRCTTPAVAHYDVNGSGCLDIADVQLILAHWGERVSPEFEQAATPNAEADANLTFTVNSDGDGADAVINDGVCATAGGNCTLRAAVQQSNWSAGFDTINFDIRPGGPGTCPAVVTILTTSSIIVDDASGAGLVIDGYSQCDAAANTAAISGNAAIKINLEGNMTEGVHGIVLNSQNNTVKGLAVYAYNSQILVRGQRAHDNFIEGNFIGTNSAQTFQHDYIPGLASNGLDVELNATINTVGGLTPQKRNIISGNDQDGLNIQGPDVSSNLFINNYIGVKQDGSTRLRNKSDGVDLAGGAHHNRIGGLTGAERNVMTGNRGDGIEISHDGTHHNEVVGNFIGLNANGTSLTGNDEKGITFEDIVSNNLVHQNVIAGNGGYGVRFYTADSNQLYDNFIGVVPTGLGGGAVIPVPGTVPFANLTPEPNGALPANDAGLNGIHFLGGSQNNVVSNNVIAHHPEYGIAVSVQSGYLTVGSCNTWFNRFTRNFIYDNGLQGIRLYTGICDIGGETVSGNQALPAPEITSATTNRVIGTACASCTVEVFIADKDEVNEPSDNNGEGKLFVASGVADGVGAFVIPITGVPVGTIVTATATSTTNNTSQFARNVAVTQGDFLVHLPLMLRNP